MQPNRRDLARAPLGAAAVLAAAGDAAVPAGDAEEVELGPGWHPVDKDRVVRGTLTLRPGARLRISRGTILTLLGDLVAPAATIFVGEGRVDLTGSRVVAARPEWWGAVPGDPGQDCAFPIEAALAAHPAVQLGPGDYYLGRTLEVKHANRRLWGIGRTNGAHGTRLLRRGGDGAVVRVGTEASPATINAYLRGIDLRWIELGRTEAPAAGAIGLAVRHVLDSVFEGLRANEHAVGFSLRGAVRTLVNDCAAFCSVFPGQADDAFIGFDLDGTSPPISTGANASLFLTDCSARTGNRAGLAGAVGCQLLGAFSDTVLTRFETTELGYGILIDGGAGAPHGRYAQLDLRLDGCVLDRCGRAGIVIRRLGATAMVEIAAPWLAVTAGAEAALHLRDTGGAITVTGGQLVATGGGASTGMLMERTAGVSLTGTKLLDTTRPVMAQWSSGFDLAVAVLAGAAPVGVAVALSNCMGGTVRARVLAPGGQVATGVALDTACRSVTVETAGLTGAAVPVRVGDVPVHGAGGVVAIA